MSAPGDRGVEIGVTSKKETPGKSQGLKYYLLAAAKIEMVQPEKS